MNIDNITSKYLNERKNVYFLYIKERGSNNEWRIQSSPKFSKLETAWKKAKKLNKEGGEWEYAAGSATRKPMAKSYLDSFGDK